MIQAENIVYEYIRRDREDSVLSIDTALDHVSLDVKPGEFIAIIGHNGSGKSTLAKHINALLFPGEGIIRINGMETDDAEHLWDIRQTAGMVFQNPDNQIVHSIVEDDVGFGPENLGFPTAKIWNRVEESLKKVGMWEHSKESPNTLSGGQKQKIAIAGILAMRPKIIILDEATSMLDPIGRNEVLAAVKELNQKEGITVLWVTHYMEEVIEADRVFIMNQGKVEMQGTPKQIFSQVEKLEELHLDVPQVTLLAHELKKEGLPIPDGILSTEELADVLTYIMQ
ncbi:MAG: energy-coupling factor transporter ATPase [Lachnoclostridium sp.]|jgi:energy-coupling factor transport system ATP-binding protein|nr:energy-coupling factor transporter ATPase [Lachnoclostridium sp.]